MNDATNICSACGTKGTGKYCNNCSQPYIIKRLTVKGIFHEVFHFFSHVDKGFLFTLKSLALRPGKMQKEYVEGLRIKHQKPFSMYFICATFAALDIYWSNIILVKYYNVSDISETAFFHQYWVLLQILMLPLYALITYLFFLKSKYNYAEIGVLMLYTFAFLFLVLIIIHLLKFIWPHLQTRYIEVPVVIFYSVITNINFFDGSKGLITIKSVISTCLCFIVASVTQDLLVKFFS